MLWAVRACSVEDTAEVGFVIAWEDDPDDGTRFPVVIVPGGPTHFAGSAVTWKSEVIDTDGGRWIERVEVYPTAEEARARAPGLYRAVTGEHHRRWPEDAASDVGRAA